ncbi:Metal transporter, ZIP family [plant metagenome]|uniref:Metal transporter, ZIP family n=1 Tax=plant metagenome TaxID=1297885 RepID=A0A484PDL8_9ZZZZ
MYIEAALASNGRIFRFAFGMVLMIIGISLLVAKAFNWLELDPGMENALKAGGVCALGTALGAVPVLVLRAMPVSAGDALLGFGAGVMLAATAFSLLIPSLEAAQAIGFGKWASSLMISAGVLLGALSLLLIDRKVACSALEVAVGSSKRQVISPRIWVFVIAIIGHNIPEGMAVGVSAAGMMSDADSLVMGMALQNVPEGLLIALVLVGAGMNRLKAFFFAAASGLVEPVTAAISACFVSFGEVALPLGLAFAAGAMLLVITYGVIPESHQNGNPRLASFGLCTGFCLMLIMDTSLS